MALGEDMGWMSSLRECVVGVTIPVLDSAPELDLWPFWDSHSNSGSRLAEIMIHFGFGSTSGSGSCKCLDQELE